MTGCLLAYFYSKEIGQGLRRVKSRVFLFEPGSSSRLLILDSVDEVKRKNGTYEKMKGWGVGLLPRREILSGGEKKRRAKKIAQTKEGVERGVKENEIDEKNNSRVSNTTHLHFSMADQAVFLFFTPRGRSSGRRGGSCWRACLGSRPTSVGPGSRRSFGSPRCRGLPTRGRGLGGSGQTMHAWAIDVNFTGMRRGREWKKNEGLLIYLELGS